MGIVRQCKHCVSFHPLNFCSFIDIKVKISTVSPFNLTIQDIDSTFKVKYKNETNVLIALYK